MVQGNDLNSCNPCDSQAAHHWETAKRRLGAGFTEERPAVRASRRASGLFSSRRLAVPPVEPSRRHAFSFLSGGRTLSPLQRTGKGNEP